MASETEMADFLGDVAVYLSYEPYLKPGCAATCLTQAMSKFRHVMLMTFQPEATATQIEAALAGLATMPDLVPGILRYDFGLDLELGDSNPNLALVADFASEDDWRAYASHPEHVAMSQAVISPIKADMTRVQYLVE